MAVLDRVRDLFGRTAKQAALSTSTVVHDKLDEGVQDDMVERALHFRREMFDSPHIDPEAFEVDGLSDEDREKYTGDYTAWSDLFGDLFKALHTLDGPNMKAPDEVKPSRELNRRIVQQIINSDSFTAVRPQTRHDEIASAFTALNLAPRLRETLETELAEYVTRANKMDEQEQEIEGSEEALEQLRQQVRDQGGQATPEQREAIKGLAQQKSNARHELADQAQQQAQGGLGLNAIGAIEDAVKEAQDDANAISNLPGTEAGSGMQLPPNEMIELAQKWKENHTLRDIAEMVGRLKRDLRYKRANRVIGGREEVIDVTLGDDLPLVLPHELVRLMDDTLELDFMRRFYERQLVQYETQGYAEAGRGPMILCLDGSGSMGGMPNVWARAVALAFVAVAKNEGRDAACVEFGSSLNEVRRWDFFHRLPTDPRVVLDFAGHMFGGGTDITAGVVSSKELIDTVPEFKTADIVLITDGHDNYGADDEALRGELVGRGVRLHGVAIGMEAERNAFLQKMCESSVSAWDLSGSNDATDHLAEVIS